jgi:hypothetical protein
MRSQAGGPEVGPHVAADVLRGNDPAQVIGQTAPDLREWGRDIHRSEMPPG